MRANIVWKNNDYSLRTNDWATLFGNITDSKSLIHQMITATIITEYTEKSGVEVRKVATNSLLYKHLYFLVDTALNKLGK